MPKSMSVIYIILIVFVVTFLAIMFFLPGKTEKDIEMEQGENIIFTAMSLEITRWPAIGPTQTVFKGAKITVTDRKVFVSQKNLFGSSYIIREIFLNEKNPASQFSGKTLWANVPVSEMNYLQAFSIQGNSIFLKNSKAVNLKYLEIKGLSDNKQFIEILNKNFN
jgi:hypothetical protein